MKKEKIFLADIAGYKEEKEEAIKLIDILSNFQTYKEKGASIPKGLLLCGEPGVGKTMFAQAISNESNAPLYEFEAGETENEETTIKTIKELFSKARETIPSIIFIDELDELVSSTDRSGFYGFQSDYSRKTLKTLLTEIDGIDSSDGILVIATTNNKGTIPPALIRSGRLEKQITFESPTAEDRFAIAKLYLEKVHATEIDARDIARKTDGFTGADIKSLVNESVIESVRAKKPLSISIVTKVIPTIKFGEIKKKEEGGPKDSVIYHEIGHFLAQYGLDGKIGSISVERFGAVAGRVEFYDDFIDPMERKSDDRSAEEILGSIPVDLGGIAGEEVFLGRRYCGSTSDIGDAYKKIELLFSNGVFGFEYLPYFEITSKSTSHSFTRRSVQNVNSVEIRCEKAVEILDEKLKVAKKLVSKWKELGEAIFPMLKEKETLSQEELMKIVKDFKAKRPANE